MDTLNFVPLLLMAAVVITVQDLLRYAKAKDLNGVIAILVSGAGGIGAVWLAAQADATENLVLVKDSVPLGLLNGASLVLLGLSVGLAAPQIVQLRKAFDNSDTASTPPMVGDAPSDIIVAPGGGGVVDATPGGVE